MKGEGRGRGGSGRQQCLPHGCLIITHQRHIQLCRMEINRMTVCASRSRPRGWEERACVWGDAPRSLRWTSRYPTKIQSSGSTRSTK